MRAVVTRVSQASVSIGGQCRGQIGQGLLILLGIGPEDTQAQAAQLAKKILGLRIFSDDQGKMNRSLSDVGGQVLVVSQFTLYGSVRKGNRPSFVGAADPQLAQPLYEDFLAQCAQLGHPTAHGEFGADMQVASVNDGPVTLLIDTDQLAPAHRP